MRKVYALFVALMVCAVSFAALNPFAYALSSSLSADEATLTINYSLNADATGVNVVIFNGETEVKSFASVGLTKGAHTMEIPTADLPKSANLTWKVKVTGTSVEAPTQESTMYGLYCPHGLAIDKDPNSDYFGRIIVAEAMDLVKEKEKTDYVSGGKGAGLYTFRPDFTTDSVCINGGLDFARKLASSGYQPWRVKISEDGRIFVSSLDLNGVAVWEVSNDLQTWTPLIYGANNADDYNMYDADGNFIAGLNCSMDVKGSGENLKLLLYSANKSGIGNSQAGYRLDEYAIGTATTFVGNPTNIAAFSQGKYALVHTNCEIIYDGEGGYWFGASRSGAKAGEPNLAHVNAEGVQDYYTEDASFYGGDGVLVHNGMLFKGKERSSSTVGNFGVYTIGKDAEGKVTLTEKWAVKADGIGRNLNEFAVDYAENLYVVGNSGEKIIAYALPYSGEVATPAAAKYAFQLAGESTEPAIKATWSIENGGSVEYFTDVTVTFAGVEKVALVDYYPYCFYRVAEDGTATLVESNCGMDGSADGMMNKKITGTSVNLRLEEYEDDGCYTGKVTAGNYRIVLAAGKVKFDGELSTEDYVLNFTVTVGDIVVPEIAAAYTVNPANYSTVKEIKEIVLTFDDYKTIEIAEPDMLQGSNVPMVYMVDDEFGRSIPVGYIMFGAVEGKANALRLFVYPDFANGAESYALEGDYTIVIPAGIVTFAEGVNKEIVLDYTVKAEVGPGVNVENVILSDIFVQEGTIIAEGEFQIFTITGQNVTDMNGRLDNGVYVVRRGNATAKVVVK
ncbi:MAG: hypothetical protein IKV26_03800 [Paludibacteraceae bacterium]|nr:hypothetical protein [Paludibacteraceae bacterium]